MGVKVSDRNKRIGEKEREREREGGRESCTSSLLEGSKNKNPYNTHKHFLLGYFEGGSEFYQRN